MKITVLRKSVYGKDIFYPACDKARIFASMLKQQSLTIEDLRKIKLLGFEVELSEARLAL